MKEMIKIIVDFMLRNNQSRWLAVVLEKWLYGIMELAAGVMLSSSMNAPPQQLSFVHPVRAKEKNTYSKWDPEFFGYIHTMKIVLPIK
jgi:hypothetical protein